MASDSDMRSDRLSISIYKLTSLLMIEGLDGLWLEKTLSLSNANNDSWTCLQRVRAAVRRLRTIRFFVLRVTTTSVLKIVICQDPGRNFDLQ